MLVHSLLPLALQVHAARQLSRLGPKQGLLGNSHNLARGPMQSSSLRPSLTQSDLNGHPSSSQQLGECRTGVLLRLPCPPRNRADPCQRHQQPTRDRSRSRLRCRDRLLRSVLLALGGRRSRAHLQHQHRWQTAALSLVEAVAKLLLQVSPAQHQHSGCRLHHLLGRLRLQLSAAVLHQLGPSHQVSFVGQTDGNLGLSMLSWAQCVQELLLEDDSSFFVIMHKSGLLTHESAAPMSQPSRPMDQCSPSLPGLVGVFAIQMALHLRQPVRASIQRKSRDRARELQRMLAKNRTAPIPSSLRHGTAGNTRCRQQVPALTCEPSNHDGQLALGIVQRLARLYSTPYGLLRHTRSVRDTGNASPRYMRMTLNYVPASHDLLRTSQMPLGVIIQPFAIPEAGDDPIQARPPPPPVVIQLASHVLLVTLLLWRLDS